MCCSSLLSLHLSSFLLTASRNRQPFFPFLVLVLVLIELFITHTSYHLPHSHFTHLVIRSIRAQRHSRLNYNLGVVTTHNFPSPPSVAAATAGLPPPVPQGSDTLSKKAAFVDPALAAPPSSAPVYIHSLQQLNTIVREANSKSR